MTKFMNASPDSSSANSSPASIIATPTHPVIHSPATTFLNTPPSPHAPKPRLCKRVRFEEKDAFKKTKQALDRGEVGAGHTSRNQAKLAKKLPSYEQAVSVSL